MSNSDIVFFILIGLSVFFFMKAVTQWLLYKISLVIFTFKLYVVAKYIHDTTGKSHRESSEEALDYINKDLGYIAKINNDV